LLLSIDTGAAAQREVTLTGLLDSLEFPAPDRDRAIRASLQAAPLVRRLGEAPTPSALRAAVHGAPLEAIALAAAMDEHGPAAAAARRWLDELRHVHLQINGDDLLAAGIARGPEVGRRLDAVLDMRLDGRLDDTPQAQLAAALEIGA
jgi:tRNA nucleotidyltransferase (CCA-adding enzyme)